MPFIQLFNPVGPKYLLYKRLGYEHLGCDDWIVLIYHIIENVQPALLVYRNLSTIGV